MRRISFFVVSVEFDRNDDNIVKERVRKGVLFIYLKSRYRYKCNLLLLEKGNREDTIKNKIKLHSLKGNISWHYNQICNVST